MSSPENHGRKVKFPVDIVFSAACKSGDKGDIIEQLETGVDINLTNADGLTALHRACRNDDLEMVQLLVDRGADINRQDQQGWTPLHTAASFSSVDIARYLMDHGADAAAVNVDGLLALDLAAQSQYFPMMDYMQAIVAEQHIDCKSKTTIGAIKQPEEDTNYVAGASDSFCDNPALVGENPNNNPVVLNEEAYKISRKLTSDITIRRSQNLEFAEKFCRRDQDFHLRKEGASCSILPTTDRTDHNETSSITVNNLSKRNDIRKIRSLKLLVSMKADETVRPSSFFTASASATPAATRAATTEESETKHDAHAKSVCKEEHSSISVKEMVKKINSRTVITKHELQTQCPPVEPSEALLMKAPSPQTTTAKLAEQQTNFPKNEDLDNSGENGGDIAEAGANGKGEEDNDNISATFTIIVPTVGPTIVKKSNKDYSSYADNDSNIDEKNVDGMCESWPSGPKRFTVTVEMIYVAVEDDKCESGDESSPEVDAQETKEMEFILKEAVCFIEESKINMENGLEEGICPTTNKLAMFKIFDAEEGAYPSAENCENKIAKLDKVCEEPLRRKQHNGATFIKLKQPIQEIKKGYSATATLTCQGPVRLHKRSKLFDMELPPRDIKI